MFARFVSNLLHLALGAALVTMSLTLAPAAVGWVALGAGSATVLVTAAAFPAPGRGGAQRLLDGLSVLLGGWMIVAACAYTGDALRWLSFGAAVVLWTLGIAGLIAHEAIMERAARDDARAALRNGRAHPGLPLPERSGVSAW